MISFNKHDDKMKEIAALAHFHSALTKEDYRIYGLKTNGQNPPILIEYSPGSDVAGELNAKCNTLMVFFSLHNIKINYDHLKDDREEDSGTDYKVYIGVRRDMRENVQFTAAVLKTIVYYLEDKIKLPSTKIGEIQKFE